MIEEKHISFRCATARKTSIYTTYVQCFADPALFLQPYALLAEQYQHEFEINGPVECEGSGIPGDYCEDCRFGTLDVIDSD